MPEPEIEFTVGEGILLFVAAIHHYDGKCRQASEPGGILFGLLNKLSIDQQEVRLFTADDCAREMDGSIKAIWRMDMDDLSLICKIVESPLLRARPDLRTGLTELFSSLNSDLARQLEDQLV